MKTGKRNRKMVDLRNNSMKNDKKVKNIGKTKLGKENIREE